MTKQITKLDVYFSEDPGYIQSQFKGTDYADTHTNYPQIDYLLGLTTEWTHEKKECSLTMAYACSKYAVGNIFKNHKYILPIENNFTEGRVVNAASYVGCFGVYILYNENRNKKENKNKKENRDKKLIWYAKGSSNFENFDRNTVAKALGKPVTHALVDALCGVPNNKTHFFSGLKKNINQLTSRDGFKLLSIIFSDDQYESVFNSPLLVSLSDIESWIQQPHNNVLLSSISNLSHNSVFIQENGSQNNPGNVHAIHEQNTSNAQVAQVEENVRLLKTKISTLNSWYMPLSMMLPCIMFLYLCYKDMPIYYTKT